MEFTISKGASAAKCSERGGELVSFVNNGKEYVWYGIAEHWSGQAPCLFPVVCRAKDDKVTVDGTDYPMKKHGLVRKIPFKPVEVTPDSVTFETESNEDTLKSYPFDFKLKITHTVFEDGFETKYTVINTGKKDMPFCIGGHPGFNCPVNEGEKFEDYSLVFDNAEGSVARNCEQVGGYMDESMPALDYIKNNEMKLNYDDFDLDAIVVENLPVKKLKLVNRNTGHGIHFEFDSFDAIGFWTPIKMSSPFICLEPWNGLPGGVNENSEYSSKKYSKVIAAGEEFTTAYKVTVI